MEKGPLSCCCLNQRLPPEWEKLEAPGSKAEELPPALPHLEAPGGDCGKGAGLEECLYEGRHESSVDLAS